MARRSKEREIKRPIITVIGEGPTERYYFQHLRDIKHYRYNCKPRFFSQQSLKEMHRLIGEVLDNNGVAMCIFDADVTRQDDKTTKEMYNRIFDDYGKREDVILCPSIPSIEFWFLLHYLNTNKYYASSDAVIEVLNKYHDFEKNSKYLEKIQWVEKLCSDNKLDTACARAESFGTKGESFSEIYKAIEIFEH